MAVKIHPQAIVESSSQLGEDVEIGPFCYIGGRAVLGDNTRVLHHATVEGRVTLGSNNTIFPYALIGGLTHDLKYEGGEPGLQIGDNNVFREYVTAHVATQSEDLTCIGSNNVFLAYSHVAHDCQIGDHLVMSSHSALGGHVEVENHVNIGWGAGVHQFCRLGRHCMVSACSTYLFSHTLHYLRITLYATYVSLFFSTHKFGMHPSKKPTKTCRSRSGTEHTTS